MNPRAVRRTAAATFVALCLTACGSTVQISSTATTPGSVAVDGLGGTTGSAAPDDATEGVPGVTTDGGSTAPQPGSTGGSTSTGVPDVGSVTPGQTAATPGAGTPASGGVASRKPVTIGVITQQQLESAAKAFGLDGVTTGDTRKQVEAVLSWIKVNGGLGGRPVRVVQYDADVTAGNTDAVMTQACTKFTQDEHVDYVVTVLGGLKVLAACLKKAGIGLFADNANFSDSTLAQFDSILGHPSEVGAGRTYDLLIDHLWSVGWLKPTSAVGVIARDNRDGHENVEVAVRRALKRHGLTAKVERFIDDTQGDGGSSASGNAVVAFRAQNVDRVISAGYSPLYFMTAAESQAYRPSYSMVSADAPGALLESVAPANQLRNAQGIGWQPFLDIGKGTHPGPVSSRETLCFDLMRKAGQNATSSLVKGFQVQVCDLLFFLKDLSDLRPDLPADLLTSTRKQLGKKFVSPATFRVDLTTRSNGMAAYRPLAFKDDCSCFQYVGPVTAAP